jgi:hypothetical protein
MPLKPFFSKQGLCHLLHSCTGRLSPTSKPCNDENASQAELVHLTKNALSLPAPANNEETIVVNHLFGIVNAKQCVS